MSYDREALSEALEIIGRSAMRSPGLVVADPDPRVQGGLILLASAALFLDSPPDGGWPGEGTAASRRADAHLKFLETDAEAAFARHVASARKR